jgi:hypothetical protein
VRDVAAAKARRAVARHRPLRGRPGTGFAFSAPFRYFATHPNAVDRCSPAPRHILRMGATFDLRHRAQPQHLQRHVIQLPAAVVAHSIVPDHKIKSFYFRTP